MQRAHQNHVSVGFGAHRVVQEGGPPVGVKTLADIYCREHGCQPEEFVWRLFWRCLPRPALPLVVLTLWLRPDHFARDWDLIRYVAGCRSWRQIEEETMDFSASPENRGWWRRVARVRVSTRTLRRIARHYLPVGRATSVTEQTGAA